MKLSKFRPSKEQRLELSTASMIDVVFLLLIFFLVTTTFVKPERRLIPNIQERQAATDTEINDLEPAVIDVFMSNGSPAYRLGAVVSNDIEEIERVLMQFEDKSVGAFVRLSDEAPYGMAAKAINVCKQTGFTQVTFVPL